MPDRPGVFAAITQALGAERINIEDFELQHISPERGGTVTLLVTGEGEARRAAELLEGQGYGVVVSAVLDDRGERRGLVDEMTQNWPNCRSFARLQFQKGAVLPLGGCAPVRRDMSSRARFVGRLVRSRGGPGRGAA